MWKNEWKIWEKISTEYTNFQKTLYEMEKSGIMWSAGRGDFSLNVSVSLCSEEMCFPFHGARFAGPVP